MSLVLFSYRNTESVMTYVQFAARIWLAGRFPWKFSPSSKCRKSLQNNKPQRYSFTVQSQQLPRHPDILFFHYLLLPVPASFSRLVSLQLHGLTANEIRNLMWPRKNKTTQDTLFWCTTFSRIQFIVCLHMPSCQHYWGCPQKDQ